MAILCCSVDILEHIRTYISTAFCHIHTVHMYVHVHCTHTYRYTHILYMYTHIHVYIHVLTHIRMHAQTCAMSYITCTVHLQASGHTHTQHTTDCID